MGVIIEQTASAISKIEDALEILELYPDDIFSDDVARIPKFVFRLQKLYFNITFPKNQEEK